MWCWLVASDRVFASASRSRVAGMDRWNRQPVFLMSKTADLFNYSARIRQILKIGISENPSKTQPQAEEPLQWLVPPPYRLPKSFAKQFSCFLTPLQISPIIPSQSLEVFFGSPYFPSATILSSYSKFKFLAIRLSKSTQNPEKDFWSLKISNFYCWPSYTIWPLGKTFFIT